MVEDTKNIFLDYMASVLDECEKKDQISSTIDDGYALSTGLLTLDIIMNGGIRSGWITSSGLEGSGKSSLAVKMLGSLVKQNIPGYFIDAEGALDTDYACSIAGIKDISEYFGRKSPKGKDWEITPKIRYTSENSLEKVFSFMQRILLKLPDKLYRQEDGKWYYVFSKEKSDVEKMKLLGLKHNASLYTQTGRYWCEAPDGHFQIVFILDSLPALVPEDVQNDADGGSNAMALQARSLSKVGPAVRGLLRRKHAVFLVINQLREKPAVMFGNPEYEPCGNFVKFASDIRNTMNTRIVPDPFSKGKLEGSKNETSQYGQEPSVEGEGTDTYVYKLIKNIKNKRGTPFRQGWCRLWISDKDLKARGFDPVFDCYKYLESTSQAFLVKKSGKREIIGLEKFIPELKSPVQWIDFKKLILGEIENNEDLLKSFKETYKIPLETELYPIYSKSFEQIESGEAFSLMINKKENVNNNLEDDLDSFEDLDEESFNESDFN